MLSTWVITPVPCLTQPFDPRIGPLIEVLASQSNRERGGRGHPQDAVRCRALADTGATNTCISRKLANILKLQVRSKREMASATGKEPANIYFADFMILFPGGMAPVFSAEVMEYASPPEHDILLGRDIICSAGGVLVLNGHENKFTLCM